MRSFLSKIDNWLAARYPILWATQAHKIFIYASIYVFLGSFAFFISQWSIPNAANIHYWWKFLYIPIVLLAIYWIWTIRRYKIEDRFGLVSKKEEWMRLFAVTGAVASLLLAPILIRDACYARLRMMIPREEFVNDLLVIKENYSNFDIPYECDILNLHNIWTKQNAIKPDTIIDMLISPELELINKKYEIKSPEFRVSPKILYEGALEPFLYAHGARDRIFPLNSEIILFLSLIIFILTNMLLPLLYTDFRTVIYTFLGYFVGSIMMGIMRYGIIGMEGSDNVLPLTLFALFLYFSMLLIGGRAKISRSPRFQAVFLLIPSVFTPMMMAICIMVFNSDLYLSIFMMQIPLFYSIIFFFGINALVWIYWTAPRLRSLYASPNAS